MSYKLEDLNYVLAATGEDGEVPSAWNFYPSLEHAKKAKEAYEKKELTNYEYFLERNYIPMSYEEYVKIQKEFYVTSPKESSKEDFLDSLECLPPRRWIKTERYETFMMSEFKTGSITSQYLYDIKKGKYWHASVDVTDKSTFIEYKLGLETL